MRFYPDMYVQSIYDINYELLKNRGIKCLLFDLDNTIVLIDQKEAAQETIDFFENLKKDFQVIIVSNNYEKRVKKYGELLKCDYISFALKPSLRAYRRVVKKYNLKKAELCMIGDQLLTDIFVGKRFSIYTIWVDAIGIKDLKITSVNRFIENMILKNYAKRGIMKKGEYYE